MTGFEPATTRPPGVYATGLRYIPLLNSKSQNLNFKKEKGILDFKFGMQK